MYLQAHNLRRVYICTFRPSFPQPPWKFSGILGIKESRWVVGLYLQHLCLPTCLGGMTCDLRNHRWTCHVANLPNLLAQFGWVFCGRYYVRMQVYLLGNTIVYSILCHLLFGLLRNHLLRNVMFYHTKISVICVL